MNGDGWDYLRELDEKKLREILSDPKVPSNIKMRIANKLIDKAAIESLDRRNH